MRESEKATVRSAALACRDALPAQLHTEKCGLVSAELATLLSEALLTRTNLSAEPDVCCQIAPFVVAAYCAMKSEVSIEAFLEEAYQHETTVCFPCMMRGSTRDAAVEHDREPQIPPDHESVGNGASVASNQKHADRNADGSLHQQSTKPRASMVFRKVSRKQYECGEALFVTHPLRTFLFDDPALENFPTIDPSLLDMVVVPLVAFDAHNNRLGYGGGNYDRLLPLLADETLVVGVGFNEQCVGTIPCEPHDCVLPRIVCA